MQTLQQNGFEAYLVGGAVRDHLLGGLPADFDLATNATPEEVLTVFRALTCVPTGISHGTVTVISSGRPVEITTYRVDGDYVDARRPESVTFTGSLAEDVKRRDFTINALAMASDGEIIDYVGGRADIEKKVIRAVGEPDKRMREDALRILRALRFSAVLGFPIEEKTRKSLFRHRALLRKISVERVYSELSGLLCGEFADQILTHYIDIIGVVIPELLPMKDFIQYNPHHKYDVLTHTAVVLKNVPPQRSLRWAALFHDSGKPRAFILDSQGVGHFYGHQKISKEIADFVLKRLKADIKTQTEVDILVLWHDVEIEPTERIIRRRLHQFGEDMFRGLMALKRADTLGQSEKSLYRLEEHAKIYELLEKILSEKSCFTLKDLAINGDDLIRMGFSKGPYMGELLSEALHAVMDGELPNEKEPLLLFAQDRKEKR
jgi:tRNA nucleotidyltransferase (CCA-adding enzyme)